MAEVEGVRPRLPNVFACVAVLLPGVPRFKKAYAVGRDVIVRDPLP